METDLGDAASVQYNDWSGTVAGDEGDLDRVSKLLGIDERQWVILVLDIYIYGGTQTISAFGIRLGGKTVPDYLRDEVESKGHVEVTRLVEFSENPHGHADTNPPLPPVLPVTWATELLACFKRIHIRMHWHSHEVDGIPFAIH